MLNLDYYFESPQFRDNNFLVLNEVTELLALGKKVNLRTLKHDTVKTSFKFRAAKDAKFPAGFYVHGTPARHIEQVLSYISGDAHDRSKVQWFDGARFHDLIKDPNSF